jgi:hypothetical protein
MAGPFMGIERRGDQTSVASERVPKFGGKPISDVRWPSKAVEAVFSTALESHHPQFRDTLSETSASNPSLHTPRHIRDSNHK